MVEKMKKYSFLIYHKTYDEFLETIRQAGVVHVVEKQKGVPDDAANLRQQLAMDATLKDTIRALQRRLGDQKDDVLRPIDPKVNTDAILSEYEQLIATEEQLTLQRQNLQREIDNMLVWGDFDLEMLQKFEKAGLRVKFYSCREREFQADWAERFDAVEVARKASIVYFITVVPAGFDEEPEAEVMRLSDDSLGHLQTAMLDNLNRKEDVQKRLNSMAVEHLNNLKEKQRQLHENIDLGKVQLQGEKKAADKLILFEGWAPEAKEPELISVLEKQDDTYFISETPDKDDKTAPILLKNNKFAKLFEPIGELYAFSHYHELDLTPFFAPFFMLFFGVCLGDTGYGLLILLATLFARSKVKPSLKPIMSLASVLGAATVVMGFVSGTFFGIPLLEMDWPWLTSFKKVMLTSDQMFNTALIIGCVQIIYAMFVRAYGVARRYGWTYSLERWGWFILFFGCACVYLAFFSNEDKTPPEFANYLLYGILGVAGLFILVLNHPKRNPLINIGAGLWSTFNMATGIIGDVLSYVRLFALGLCGSVMGFVFNQLAIEISPDIPVLGQLLTVFILLFGHSLNIFMSCLGAFVHPMRLTFVEFYKNAGFEGGGKKYKPFGYIPAES